MKTIVGFTALMPTICNYIDHPKPRGAVLTVYASHSSKNPRNVYIVDTNATTLCKKCLDFCVKIGQVSIEV